MDNIAKSKSSFFGFYYLLYFLSYLSIFEFPQLSSALNLLIILSSYYLILVKKRFDVILMLMLYSRCINGFIIPHNKLFFDIFNILTSVFPILLYFTVNVFANKVRFEKGNLSKQKFTYIFFIYLTISFILNFSTAVDLITKRYLPFALFVLYLFMFNNYEDFSFHGIIRFLRATFLAALIIYFFPSYLGKMKQLVESDMVFGTVSAKNSFSLIYLSFVRNFGFAWDHRIMATLSYLYLVIALIYRQKYFTIDILLSASMVITSTSRGGMVTYALIIAVYLFQLYRKQFTIGLIITAILAGGIVLISKNIPPSSQLAIFINSFNPKAKKNAIKQRAFFSDYAINTFKEKPVLGHGVGYLSSKLINRHLIVNGQKVPAVTDAYWFTLMAEMGLIGLLLYILFLLEVFYSTSLMNIALLIGFSVQLLGTDIPDMRFFYLSILILVHQINFKLTERLRPVTHEKN